MKTLVRATRKSKRLLVPMTPFQFEEFDVPVRRLSDNGPLQSKAAFRKVNSHHRPRPLKIFPTAIEGAQPPKVFMPSPSLHGLMLWRLGTRPVAHAPALSSGHSSLGSVHDPDACERCEAFRFPHAFCVDGEM